MENTNNVKLQFTEDAGLGGYVDEEDRLWLFQYGMNGDTYLHLEGLEAAASAESYFKIVESHYVGEETDAESEELDYVIIEAKPYNYDDIDLECKHDL